MPKPIRAQKTIGAVRPLDATRTRRAGAVQAGGATTSAPVTLDEQGRITLALTGNLAVIGGKLGQRVDGDTVEIVTGSAPRMRVRTAGLLSDDDSVALDVNGRIKAQPTAIQVRADPSATGIAGATVEAQLTRLQANQAITAAEVDSLQALPHTTAVPFCTAKRTWAAFPVADTFLFGDVAGAQPVIDLTGYTEYRLTMLVGVNGGPSGGKLQLRYRASYDSDPTRYDPIASGVWAELTGGASTDLTDGWTAFDTSLGVQSLAIVGYDGDGATALDLGTVLAQFR